MYDFDEQINRRKTNSYKWAIAEDELPLWVADMDFRTAPEVTATLQKRLDEGVFGYNIVTEEFNQSIIHWWQTQHQFTIQSEWILFCTGVVPAISSIVRKMTTEEDAIVLLTPVYNIFFNSILNNHRQVLPSELRYENGNYTIDFTDLEEKLAKEETKMMIFCNPHNPTGKVWTKDILRRVGELCLKYNVFILSDEIHCDLAHEGYAYTPFASISEEIAQQTITCVAATKAFNLAGLQTSAIIIPNATIRKQVNRGINTDEVAEPNTFAIQATTAAFEQGAPWLVALKHYLATNRKYLKKKLNAALPEVRMIDSEATYLAWIDCSEITDDTTKLCEFLRKTTGVYLSDGDIFGGNGKQFIRLNYACPKQTLVEGVNRLVKGMELYKRREEEPTE
ncbi:MAG: MalY/PatB family protein [Enterococcus sp.]